MGVEGGREEGEAKKHAGWKKSGVEDTRAIHNAQSAAKMRRQDKLEWKMVEWRKKWEEGGRRKK